MAMGSQAVVWVAEFTWRNAILVMYILRSSGCISLAESFGHYMECLALR